VTGLVKPIFSIIRPVEVFFKREFRLIENGTPHAAVHPAQAATNKVQD
jgi:hypothetical protein